MSTQSCQKVNCVQEMQNLTIKNLLDILWELLDGEAQNIRDYILGDQTQPYESEVFEAIFKFQSLESRPRETRGKLGVYVFMVTKPVELNFERVSGWNNISNAGFKSVHQESLRANDCLYVGSCTTNSIYSRMTQHFGEKQGLQIKNKKRAFILDSVCVYAFLFSKKYKDYEHIILPCIEKRLHIYMEPKAGSSRV